MKRLLAVAGISFLSLTLGFGQTDVQRDRRDIRQDRRDIAHDKADINHDARVAARASKNGNLVRANRAERDMRHDARDLKHDKRDLRRDKADLRHDR